MPAVAASADELLHAAEAGDAEHVRQLLAANADVNHTDVR